MPAPTNQSILTLPTLAAIERAVPTCTQCPELREYCERVAREKRRSFIEWDYWGKPVAGFGDHDARILILGLAPAAHGANRTGRMFTGDRSGDFLYAALHRAGMANQPTATDVDDGLKLRGVYITASLRCAPPANKPTPKQLASCSAFLDREIAIIEPAVILCLGGIAWDGALRAMRRRDVEIPSPKPKFGHGAEVQLGAVTMLSCYHVSQQNTFTGRLTGEMIDHVLARAKEHAGG